MEFKLYLLVRSLIRARRAEVLRCFSAQQCVGVAVVQSSSIWSGIHLGPHVFTYGMYWTAWQASEGEGEEEGRRGRGREEEKKGEGNALFSPSPSPSPSPALSRLCACHFLHIFNRFVSWEIIIPPHFQTPFQRNLLTSSGTPRREISRVQLPTPELLEEWLQSLGAVIFWIVWVIRW